MVSGAWVAPVPPATYAHNSFPDAQWENGTEVFLTKNWFGRRGTFVQDHYTKKAIDFIKCPSSQLLFLYLAYTSPHADNERGAAEPNGIDVPDNQPYQNEPWSEVERSFAALVTRLDRDTGAVLKAIHDAGLDANTLVIFTSDNGPHREGNHNPGFFHSSGELRGIKRDLDEGGIRIPFLARWPGKIAPGTTPQVTAFWDMLPTLCELAGVSPAPAIDGVSITAALLKNTGIPHPPLYWEFHERGFKQALRDGDWKAIRTTPGPPIELYNLSKDPNEKTNPATTEPVFISRFDMLLNASRTNSAAFPVRYESD